MIKESSKIKALDLICLVGETFDPSEDLKIFDPISTWKKSILPQAAIRSAKCSRSNILKRTVSTPLLLSWDIKAYYQQELNTLWDENRRLMKILDRICGSFTETV